MQKERDEYLKQELANAQEAAQNLAKKQAKADKDVQEAAASCAASEAAISDLKASKASIEEQCRLRSAEHTDVTKQHNSLLDKYDLS